MTSLILIFGSSPRLSEVEFRSVYPSILLTMLNDRVGIIQTDIDPTTIIYRLGGVVKISRCISIGQSEVDIDGIVHELSSSRHVDFGVSWYGEAQAIHQIDRIVKDRLVNIGISARYITPSNDKELSSVVSKNIREIIVVAHEGVYTTGIVFATQDYKYWQTVDRSRPVADAKRGMLPPKVARMAVNIAVGNNPVGKILLDPFCGVGTIPTEAIMMGVETTVASDIDSEAIDATKKNLEWFRSSFPISSTINTEIFTQDATHISASLAPGSIDAIVTEPFMGDPKVAYVDRPDLRTEERVKNTLKGLTKLYIGCLREWKVILKPGARIVIAFPQYAINGKIFGVKNVVDMCEKYGYTVEDGPIEYGRTGAIVRRAFYVITVS